LHIVIEIKNELKNETNSEISDENEVMSVESGVSLIN
jgi:hypothetical protein